MGLGIAGIFDVLRVSVVTTDIFLAPFLFCRCVFVASMELFVLGVGMNVARQTQLGCATRLLHVECILFSLVLLYTFN